MLCCKPFVLFSLKPIWERDRADGGPEESRPSTLSIFRQDPGAHQFADLIVGGLRGEIELILQLRHGHRAMLLKGDQHLAGAGRDDRAELLFRQRLGLLGQIWNLF